MEHEQAGGAGPGAGSGFADGGAATRWEEARPETPDAADESTGDEAARAPVAAGWTPVRRLGRGGQAEAWLVRDTDGAEAVLKVAAPGGDPAPLQAEAEAYGRLRHDHLLPVLGTVPTDRGVGVLSEHLPAGSLATLVREAGPLTPGQAVTVLVPVAQALAHLHRHGVVHGDVSPANVLFAVDGRPALADLGVARVVGGAQGAGGTPGFLAPEQELEADGRAGAPTPGGPEAADVYGWAALGWYALTGRAPAAAEHRAPLPVLVPSVPLDLALLLDAGLDPDPSRRPTAEDAARAAYATTPPEPVPLQEAAPVEVAHLLPTLPPPAPAAGRVGRGGRRRRGRGPATRRGSTAAQTGAVGERARRPGPRAVLAAGAVGLAAAAGIALLTAGQGRDASPAASPPVVASAPPAPSGLAASTDSGDRADRVPDPSTAAASSAGANTAAPAGEAAPAPLDDAAVQGLLDGVAEARTAALTDPRRERLDVYAVPESPAWRRDRDVQEQLASGGWAFAGLALEARLDGRARAEGEDGLRVPVRLTTGAHTVLDARGTVREEVPERTDAVELVLSRDGDGPWRVAAVEPR